MTRTQLEKKYNVVIEENRTALGKRIGYIAYNGDNRIAEGKTFSALEQALAERDKQPSENTPALQTFPSSPLTADTLSITPSTIL